MQVYCKVNNYTIAMLKMIAEAGRKAKLRLEDDVHYWMEPARKVMEKNIRVVYWAEIVSCSLSVLVYETEGC